MRTRLEFRNMLKSVVGDGVTFYFQPPEGQMLNYPCLIYSRGNPLRRHADNKVYNHLQSYDLLLIVEGADDLDLYETISGIQYCSPGKPYSSDGLYHYPFTIYF